MSEFHEDMKDIEIIRVVVAAKPNATQGRAMQQAMQIAVREWRNVTLIFNDRYYRINVNDMMGTITDIEPTNE